MTDLKECSVDGCDKFMVARTYCSGHYARWREGRPIEGQLKAPVGRAICTVRGCGKFAHAKGLCSTHHQRFRRGLALDTPIQYYTPAGTKVFTCSIEGCERRTYARNVCHPHYETEFPDVRKRHEAYLRERYKMTWERYSELVEAQNGVCAMCSNSPTAKRRLVVDHDHACCPGNRTCGNCVRGILCLTCNVWLGVFESVEIQANAERYLQSNLLTVGAAA